MAKIWTFIKKEAVFCIAAVCAVLTMFLVPPDGGYPGYIDLRVLCLLLRGLWMAGLQIAVPGRGRPDAGSDAGAAALFQRHAGDQ